MQGFIVLAAGIAASVAIFHAASLPFAWVAFLWSAIFVHTALRRAKRGRGALWFNGAVALFLLGGYELFLWWGQQDSGQIHYAESYTESHEILGYAPRKGQTAPSTRRRGAETEYEVVYTIGEDGLRITPQAASGTPCVLFFGDSITFGEGVDDDESLPYRVGLALGERYRTHNFGFHGYGPHQMLAALERGLVDEVAACRPRYAFYLAIFDHVSRAAGLRSWDPHGPHYVLDQGEVVYGGHFDDGALLPAPVRKLLEKSLIFQRLQERASDVDADDVALFVGIVDAARDRFEHRYPGSEFHVLQWGDSEGLAGSAWQQLRDRGIRVHGYFEMLPDAARDAQQYAISEHDLHPNARAHELLASYVAGVVAASEHSRPERGSEE
jgi:hypothetical protein